MSKRKTRCLTWGEERRWSTPILNSENEICGRVCFASYVTLCGKDDENVRDAIEMPESKRKRPIGVCPSCWVKYRNYCAKFPIDQDQL